MKNQQRNVDLSTPTPCKVVFPIQAFFVLVATKDEFGVSGDYNMDNTRECTSADTTLSNNKEAKIIIYQKVEGCFTASLFSLYDILIATPQVIIYSYDKCSSVRGLVKPLFKVSAYVSHL